MERTAAKYGRNMSLSLSLSLSLGAASVMEGMHSLISWRRAMFRCCFGKETSV
jgi:hypothetical protein